MGIMQSTQFHRGKAKVGRRLKKKPKVSSKTRRSLRGYLADLIPGGKTSADFQVSPSGAIVKRHKSRGLSAKEIRGFKKVVSLLRKVGYKPKMTKSRRF